MRDPRHDLLLDILLDIFPLLALLGSLGREYLSKIPRLDRGDYLPFRDIVIVVHNW